MRSLNSAAFILIFSVLVVSVSAYAKAPAPLVSRVVTQGGLTCFSITPAPWPRHAKNSQLPTCDALCAAHGAACAGMQNGAMNPPATCGDHVAQNYGVCRCCSVNR